MDKTIGWLGLDCHSNQCVLALVDDEGLEVSCQSLPTRADALVKGVVLLPKKRKHLMLEEGELSRWVARLLKPYVESLVVCDPRYNHHLSRHHNKRDDRDAFTLARLRRLGEYREIWQATEPDRIAFRQAAGSYEDAVRHQTRVKLQIKSEYRQWGVIAKGSEVYHPDKANRYLKQVPEQARRPVQLLYEWLECALRVEKLALRHLVETGRGFAEVARLRKVPGVGLIGSNLFVAYVQDPSRFCTNSELSRYCRLGICERTSDGKPLGYQRLDRSGQGVLKAISYRAWLTAVRRRTGPVWQFCQESRRRTGSEIHARLNTQRKVLWTLRQLWLRKEEFDPKRFLASNSSAI
jgi:transposase